MFEFHKDKDRYFEFQYLASRDHILPFVADHVDLSGRMQVLEIGSAEAGVLKAFTELGHQCVGIELSPSRVARAEKLLAEEVSSGKVRFLASNIHDIDPDRDIGHKFDLIILKDVIEHIHDRPRFMASLGKFLNPGGKVFFGFPPWQMPFGGHQQICKSRILSKLPYIHVLPRAISRSILKTFGESEKTIENLLEIKETRISLGQFERMISTAEFRIVRKRLYLVNPIYHYKFGIKPRRQSRLVGAIPYIRNFFTSAGYYLVERA